jgi:hypothetical protein
MSPHNSHITCRQAPQGDPPLSVDTANALKSEYPSEIAVNNAVRSAQLVRENSSFLYYTHQ